MRAKKKRCVRCMKWKPATTSYFYKQVTNRDNLHGACKECQAEYQRERYRTGKGKTYMKLRKYGITQEDYEALFERQEGKCAICRKESSKALKVDHCHETSRVRGLLCLSCNVGLGHFQDCAELLDLAAKYLRGDIFFRKEPI